MLRQRYDLREEIALLNGKLAALKKAATCVIDAANIGYVYMDDGDAAYTEDIARLKKAMENA